MARQSPQISVVCSYVAQSSDPALLVFFFFFFLMIFLVFFLGASSAKSASFCSSNPFATSASNSRFAFAYKEIGGGWGGGNRGEKGAGIRDRERELIRCMP